jgi:hypothetical protein
LGVLRQACCKHHEILEELIVGRALITWLKCTTGCLGVLHDDQSMKVPFADVIIHDQGLGQFKNIFCALIQLKLSSYMLKLGEDKRYTIKFQWKFCHFEALMRIIILHTCTLIHLFFSFYIFRILALEAGQVREFDSPKNLLEEKTSLFYSLAKSAGLTE